CETCARARSREAPVRLAGADSPPLTKLAVTAKTQLAPGSPEASCIARQANGATPIGSAVRRIGVTGESVTFRVHSAVVACDGVGRASRNGGRWCGGSYGRLFARHLHDPRPDIAG